MNLRTLTRASAAELAVLSLGLDEELVDLQSPEALCASLRRAASFLCPATPRGIVDVVLDAVTALDPEEGPTRQDLMDMLDHVIAVGDLVELRQEGYRTTRQLFLGPPSFVEKVPGEYLLLGVRPFAAPLVDAALAAEVRYDDHMRTIVLDAETGPAKLAAAGVHHVPRDLWLRLPRRESAGELVAEVRERLLEAGRVSSSANLSLVDSSTPVRYYRGRWRPPEPSDQGDFVARRQQAYGADRWCVIRMVDGAATALVDLPLGDPTAAGCDEAWRLQAALDAERGGPQVFRLREVAGVVDAQVLDLFAPLPSWMQRAVELIGWSVPRAGGSLFSYRVPSVALPGLVGLLTDMLWMRQFNDGGRR
jgi:hypothetical protein